MPNEWTQISGDMTASEYGAMFGQLDTIGDKVYGVEVVEIINMLEATGDDSTADKRYYVETYYCDTEDTTLARMRDVMRSCGWLDRQETDKPEYPETVQERVTELQTMLSDYQQLLAWQTAQGLTLNDTHTTKLHDVYAELDTLHNWYSIPRMMRAEAMASYGGCESDNYSERSHKTLARAMASQGIPRSALWRESEYDSMPDDVDVGNGTRLSITLPYNVSVYHREGIDSDGNVWTEYDMRGYLDMYDDGNSTCTGCGERIESQCWHDNDGMMEQYCPDCVDYTYGHITLPTFVDDSWNEVDARSMDEWNASNPPN